MFFSYISYGTQIWTEYLIGDDNFPLIWSSGGNAENFSADSKQDNMKKHIRQLVINSNDYLLCLDQRVWQITK